VPLWIPQSGMALGLAVLFITVADDLVAVLRGRQTSYDATQARATHAMPGFER